MFPQVHGVVSQGGIGTTPPAATLGGRAFYEETSWSSIDVTHQYGWRFTVGANDIDVGALMIYDADGGTETVRLWRVIDQALLASAVVTSVGGWGETPITPVTLASGADYIISRRRADGALRTVHVNPADELYDSGISFVSSLRVDADSIPTDSLGNQAGVNFRTVAPLTGYRFWRFNCTAVNGGTRLRLSEIELRAVAAGADVTTPTMSVTTTSQQSTPLFAAKNCFDNNNSTIWVTVDTVTSASVTIDLGSSNEQNIVQYTIRNGNTANQSPTAWTLEASNDLVNWTTVDTVAGETGWSTDETRTYNV